MSLQNGTLVGTIYIAGGGSEPVLQEKTVSATVGYPLEVVPDQGFDGLSLVTVRSVTLDTLDVTPSYSEQSFTPEEPAIGFRSVYVGPIPATADTLQNMLNTQNQSVDLTMVDNNYANTCYGFHPIFLTLPATITTIAEGAFEDTNMLYTVNAPGVTTIGDSAFKGCKSLGEISFPELTAIPESCFENCLSLGDSNSSVRFPAVQSIGFESFSGCRFEHLYLGYSGVVGVNYQSFDGFTSDLVVHVPAGQLSAYQADSDWATMIAAFFTAEGRTCTFVGDYDA